MDMSSKKASVSKTELLPSYKEIIHLIIEDAPPSYEKVTGITNNNQSVSGTLSMSYQRKIFQKMYFYDPFGCSRRRVFCEKAVWKNFGKFTGKRLYWNRF